MRDGGLKAGQGVRMKNAISAPLFKIALLCEKDCLWSYRLRGSSRVLKVAPPVFEIGGHPVRAVPGHLSTAGRPVALPNGCTEHFFSGELKADKNLALEFTIRVAKDNPIVRFKYALRSATEHVMTKGSGNDALSYMVLSFPGADKFTEVRLSEFNPISHGFCISERRISHAYFESREKVMGPILAASGAGLTWVAAYEHGSQVPDAFVTFSLSPDRKVAVEAVKGNYHAGRKVSENQPYETIWFHAGAVRGGLDDLAKAYRDFVLKRMSVNLESRKPYIFYNSWAFQERNKWWNGKTFLDSMNQERMLKEIDAAHRLGIDVFVLDSGWYEKTGDWRASRVRFPDGLKAVREKLEGYGMKMGLWFNPTVAALSSEMHRRHQDCLMTWNGRPHDPHPIWETEESQGLCLVSRYAEAFTAEMVRLNRELGVAYFKWDAVGQYGCNDAGHRHGGPDNSPQERADCYAFEQCRAMADIVDGLCAAVPEAIADFDITEAHRTVGLSFLSASKYFLQNNGPYFFNYDVPQKGEHWVNMLVHPGPARAWNCRYPYDYDRWIPAILLMTHYLPDDPEDSQLINLGSCILGHNGIWGDLPAISEKGAALVARLIRLYKQVRDDVTESFPVRSGAIGGSPEVHEKISGKTGRGVVVVFSSEPGTYTYITENRPVRPLWHTPEMTVDFDAKGRAVIRASFEKPGARIVYFGVTSG